MVQYFFSYMQSLMAREEEGQGLVEYALIIALIAIVAIADLTLMGTSITTMLTGVAGKIKI